MPIVVQTNVRMIMATPSASSSLSMIETSVSVKQYNNTLCVIHGRNGQEISAPILKSGR